MRKAKRLTIFFASGCLVIVAGIVNAEHLYYMAGLMLALPLVSYTVGWYGMRGIRFERETPGNVWEGEECDITYIAHNPTATPRYFMSVSEKLPDWITPLCEEPPLFNVDAQGTARVTVPVSFTRRGLYKSEKFYAESRDPLDIFAFVQGFPCDGEIVVYPRPLTLDESHSSGAERFGWQDFTAAALRGSSIEPAGVRPYAPGDPLRRIHWRQTARTGILSVLEFDEALVLDLVVVLDCRPTFDAVLQSDEPFEFAVRAAASLVEQGIHQGANVRLVAPADALTDTEEGATRMQSRSSRGQDQLMLMLDSLARVQAVSIQPASLLLGALGEIASSTSVFVITCNPEPDLADAAAALTASGATVSVGYVDPASFGAQASHSSSASRFAAGLSAVQARLYRLAPGSAGNLHIRPVRGAAADARRTEAFAG